MLPSYVSERRERDLLANLVHPWSEFFPANAVVQSQLVIDLPAILGIDAGEVSPIVQLFVISLLKRIVSGHEAQLKISHRIGIGGSCAESEAAIRLEIIGHVKFSQFQ